MPILGTAGHPVEAVLQVLPAVTTLRLSKCIYAANLLWRSREPCMQEFCDAAPDAQIKSKSKIVARHEP